MATDKRFLWLAQTPSGAFYAWNQEASLPEWQDQLGSGPGDMIVTLPRVWGAVGVPGDAAASADIVLSLTGATQVRLYVLDPATAALAGGTIWGAWTWGSSTWGDPPAGLGQLVYAGQIEETTANLGPTKDDLQVQLLPAHTCLSEYFDNTVTFTGVDPLDAARWFFDHGYLPNLSWHPGNPASSGRQITQTFEYQTYRSILDFCTQAAGGQYYNHVDERNRFALWKPDLTQPATHVVQVGRELVEASYQQTRTLQKNEIVCRGKGGIVAIAKSVDWSRANCRSAVYNLPDVTDLPTLQLLAQVLLDRLNILSLRAKFTLVSSDGGLAAVGTGYNVTGTQPGLGRTPPTVTVPTSTRGYLLESVRPGDTLLLHLDQGDPNTFVWGAATWGTARWAGGEVDLVQTPQVVAATYYHGGDTLDVDLSTPRPAIVAAHQRVARLAEQALGATVV